MSFVDGGIANPAYRFSNASALYSGSLPFRGRLALSIIHSLVGLLFKGRIFTVFLLQTTSLISGVPYFA